MPGVPLHVRWLGQVRYQDALALQHGLHEASAHDHLLLLEHPHTYTLGVRADTSNVLVDPASVGAELVRSDRGGDVTYHGPGHLVGYPILHLPGKGGGDKPDSAGYVHDLEQVIIDALGDLGLDAGRLDGYPGVWVDAFTFHPRKVCAIGVKVTNGKSMHGFGLNVDPDMAMFDHIVPCGISDKAVTSLRAEGIDASMQEVVDVVVARAAARWGGAGWERQDVVWRHADADADLSPFSRGEGPGESATQAGTSARLQGRLAQAGVTEGLEISARKPEWMRAKVRLGDDVLRVKRTVRELSLVTVCSSAEVWGVHRSLAV